MTSTEQTTQTDQTFADQVVMDGWIDVRDAAYRRFLEAGFPGKKDERWLYSDVKRFTRPRGPVEAPGIEGMELPELDLPRVVLVDGHLANKPRVDGLRIRELADSDHNDVARQHLAGAPGDAFSDLNLACFQGGLLLDASKDAKVHVVHIFTGGPDTVCFPRLLVHARDGVRLTVAEHAIGPGTGFACAETEIHAHDSAVVDHITIQDRAPDAVHLHGIHAVQAEASRLTDATLSIGAGTVRHSLESRLDGAGAHAAVLGITLAGSGQRMDTWTRVDHAVADTTSDELVKCVLAADGRSGFTGNLLVRPDAQRIAATQENRNLLLSREALAESTPQLEIHADDVQCSHGSTVGQLSKEQLFALQSRGIGAARARMMLTEAFVGEVIEKMPEAVRAYAESRVASWFEEAA